MTERTDQALWEKIKKDVMKKEMAGTRAGQWSARKAQQAVRLYKEAGGGYVGEKKRNDLVKWTEQDWTTRSGMPSSVTGERYLPRKAIDALTPQQYGATTRAKREGTKKGKQFVPQPKTIKELVREFRA